MPTYQPSLWDNIALEKAYRHLLGLEIEKAIGEFKNALAAGTHTLEIEKALSACGHWRPKINLLQNNGAETGNLLDDYLGYHFHSNLSGFKKKLLLLIADSTQKGKPKNLATCKILFDQLLLEKEYQKAASFMGWCIPQFPKESFLHYFLAQAQWLDNEKDEAKKNYARALLYCPDNVFLETIENGRLKNIVKCYGPEMAPCWGWYYRVLKLVPLEKKIEYLGPTHQRGVEAYGLLRKLENPKADKDKLQYREKLQSLAPEFYKSYMQGLE
jgi:hypothetical protein